MKSRAIRLFLGALFFSSLSSITPIANAASSPDCTQSANTKCLVTFSYTGAVETFMVPAGISSIYFDVEGAQGGGTNGGQGGIDTGTLNVIAGSTLYVRVGGQGTLGLTAAGGFNGGGSTSAGDTPPGSGGGASDIRFGADNLASRVVVAGGGGGQSSYCALISQPSKNYGGAGGGLIGGNGGGSSGCWASTEYGRGGTQSAGGSIGTYSGYGNTPGSLGQGGIGKGNSAGGGGGGGGYYGGGGGLVEAGGGGSSYVDTNTAHSAWVGSYSLAQGGRTGNGIISFTYQNLIPAKVSIATPSTATFRATTVLTSTSDSPGKVTFYAAGKAIPGCKGILNSGSGSIYTATCNWRPSVHGNQLITVSIAPSNGNIGANASAPLIGTSSRSNNR